MPAGCVLSPRRRFFFLGEQWEICVRWQNVRAHKRPWPFVTTFVFLTKALLPFLSTLSICFYPSLSFNGTFLRKSHSPMVYVG